MFVTDGMMDNLYRGHNPKFVKRVWAKRREQELLARIEREKDRRRKEEEENQAQRERMKREVARREALAVEAEQIDSIDFNGSLFAKDIISIVAHHHGLTYADVIGPNRARNIIKARDYAIRAVADARPDWSLPHLGRIFGGRDHTTILHSLKKTVKPGQAR
jgi:hypothetical protein